MGVRGKFTSLSCLEIENIRSCRRTLRPHQLLRLIHSLRGETERPVSFLAARDGLEDHVTRRSLFDRLDLGGDMS